MEKVELHDGTVFLEPTVTVPMAMGALSALEGTPATAASMEAMLVSVYLQPVPAGAIVGWEGARFTETTSDGIHLIDVTADSIKRLIPWTDGGLEVAEKCNSLYAGDLFRPLALRRAKSSPPGPMDDSTSPSPETGSTPRKQSRRSSPNGTAGSMSVAPVR
jgi:hypothetical protein